MDRLQTSWAQNYVESSNSHDDTAFGAIWSGHLRDPWWELFFVDVSSNTLLFFLPDPGGRPRLQYRFTTLSMLGSARIVGRGTQRSAGDAFPGIPWGVRGAHGSLARSNHRLKAARDIGFLEITIRIQGKTIATQLLSRFALLQYRFTTLSTLGSART
jgi:hypothetical protein